MTREEAIDILKNTIVRFGRTNGKTAYVEALQIAIKALEEPQWIPCSSRLPEEDGGLYLVTDYAKSINRRRIHLSRCYMNKDYFWSDVLLGYKVIAWMPLPEPWKG